MPAKKVLTPAKKRAATGSRRSAHAVTTASTIALKLVGKGRQAPPGKVWQGLRWLRRHGGLPSAGSASQVNHHCCVSGWTLACDKAPGINPSANVLIDCISCGGFSKNVRNIAKRGPVYPAGST